MDFHSGIHNNLFPYFNAIVVSSILAYTSSSFPHPWKDNFSNPHNFNASRTAAVTESNTTAPDRFFDQVRSPGSSQVRTDNCNPLAMACACAAAQGLQLFLRDTAYLCIFRDSKAGHSCCCKPQLLILPNNCVIHFFNIRCHKMQTLISNPDNFLPAPKTLCSWESWLFSSIFWHISLSRSIPSQLPAVPFQIIASTLA